MSAEVLSRDVLNRALLGFAAPDVPGDVRFA
jgi:hypothetical protein